jgi:hypothetical protein
MIHAATALELFVGPRGEEAKRTFAIGSDGLRTFLPIGGAALPSVGGGKLSGLEYNKRNVSNYAGVKHAYSTLSELPRILTINSYFHALNKLTHIKYVQKFNIYNMCVCENPYAKARKKKKNSTSVTIFFHHYMLYIIYNLIYSHQRVYSQPK